MSLWIRRFRVTAPVGVVYDEPFLTGINVIEGENSSGKSTLVKLLYHALGGTIPERQWSDAAKSCNRVYVELAVGQASITVSRKAVENGLPPIIVYDGDMAQALASPLEQWQEFPYSRSESRQSYSQLLFSLLGMPDAFGEQGDFVTFNQFLRAHYADQESPNTTVLRYEDQFDKPSTREAIGNFLLGGTDHNLARREQELREAEKEYGLALASVSSANALLGSDYNELSLDGLQARLAIIEQEMQAVQERLAQVRASSMRPFEAADVDDGAISELTSALTRVRSDLSDRIGSRADLALEIADSEVFIKTLEDRATFLAQSIHTASAVGDLALDACPICGSDVEVTDHLDHCYLCKAKSEGRSPSGRYLSLLNSIQSQLEQSRRIQKTRASHIDDLDRQIAAAREEMRQIGVALERHKLVVTTSAQADLADMQQRLGYLEGDRDRALRDIRVVERLEALRDTRDRLSSRMLQLREEIEVARNSGALRLGSALSSISRQTGDILKADLDRQQEFHDDPHVEINYRANTFAIDGQRSFSASSTAYLRNAIFLGTMFAANKTETMRHLQLLLLENLEDKGMEPDRYHRLHRTIVDKSEALTGDWQIIIATADLASDVRDDVNLVGRFYTHADKTLRLGAPVDD